MCLANSVLHSIVWADYSTRHWAYNCFGSSLAFGLYIMEIKF